MNPSRLMVAALALVFATVMQAQISIRLNIGAAPEWAPSVESNVRYYYLPDVDAYYDIPSAMFIYIDNGQWIQRRHLPERFRDYDLHRCHKVVLRDYHGEAPYSYYRRTYRDEPQRNYDRSRDERPAREYDRGENCNNLQAYEVSYHGNRKYRGEDCDRYDHDRGRGYAYGRYKNGKD